jgi:predicted dehydrogenase
MKWRAALIGCGKIGSEFSEDPRPKGIQSHAHAYTSSLRTELVAVCDSDPGKASACAARWKVNSVYHDPGLLLAKQRPEIVSICTPDSSHFTVARQVLNCPGVRAVLLEKPLALCLKEATRLVDLGREKGIKLAVNYSRRYASSHQQLRQFLQSGRLGRVQAVTGCYTKGVLHNGTHWFDLIRFLTGEIKSVLGRNTLAEETADPTLSAWLALAGGASAFLHGCDAGAFTLFECDIVGTLGRARLLDSGNRFEFFETADDPNYSGYRGLKPVAGPAGGMEDALPNAVADLISCLDSDRQPLCSGADGLAALRVGLAARDSAVLGRPVDLETPA